MKQQIKVVRITRLYNNGNTDVFFQNSETTSYGGTVYLDYEPANTYSISTSNPMTVKEASEKYKVSKSKIYSDLEKEYHNDFEVENY